MTTLRINANKPISVKDLVNIEDLEICDWCGIEIEPKAYYKETIGHLELTQKMERYKELFKKFYIGSMNDVNYSVPHNKNCTCLSCIK